MKEKLNSLERLCAIEGLRSVGEPVVLAELGSGYPIVAVTAAMHGNEEVGVYILDTIRKTVIPKKGTVRLVVTNTPALFSGVRFLSEDLNRAFPGELSSTGETGLARKVLDVVLDSDFTIDLHTTGAVTDSFVIVGRKNKQRLELAEKTGVSKIVLFESQKDCAMADFVKCGIGIELGLHASNYAYDSGLQAVRSVLGNLGIIPGFPQDQAEREYYEVFGKIQKPLGSDLISRLKNFEPVRQGEVIAYFPDTVTQAEEDFYPLFAGETSYTDTLCIKARQLKREDLLKGKL